MTKVAPSSNHAAESVAVANSDGVSSTQENCAVDVEPGTHNMKREVIRPNDIIVNTSLKKMKLESDWVDKVVKKTWWRKNLNLRKVW